MRTSRLFAATLGLASLFAPPALAAPSVLEACKRELAQAGCKPANEGEAHECLEKVEKEGEKDEGFSHRCYEAHERYEKRAGHEETGEPEHHEPRSPAPK